jgi:hypothetical protein
MFYFKAGFSIALFSFSVLSIPAYAQVIPEITSNTRLISEADVRKAYSEFMAFCTTLRRASGDIVRIEARAFDELAPNRQAKGWKASIHLSVTLKKNNLQSLPTYHPATGVVAGHTLHYYLGGGASPGVFASKRVSQFLCGMPVDDSGTDTFASLASLRFLR